MSKQRVPLQHYAGPDRLERWYDTAAADAGTGLSGSGIIHDIVHIWGPVAVPTVIDHIGCLMESAGVGWIRFVICRAADGVVPEDLIADADAGEVIAGPVDLADNWPSYTEMAYMPGLEDLTEEERTLQPGDKLVALAEDDAGDWSMPGAGFAILGRTKAPVPEATMADLYVP